MTSLVASPNSLRQTRVWDDFPCHTYAMGISLGIEGTISFLPTQVPPILPPLPPQVPAIQLSDKYPPYVPGSIVGSNDIRLLPSWAF